MSASGLAGEKVLANSEARLGLVDVQDTFGTNPLCPAWEGERLASGIDARNLDLEVARLLNLDGTGDRQARQRVDRLVASYRDWRECLLDRVTSFYDGSDCDLSAAFAEVKDEEEESDRREVHIEQECLRVLALYEPVASDLRRLATILKVNRDWERIADLALRIARRARKLSRLPGGVAMPEEMKQLAREALSQVRACYGALEAGDTDAARRVIAGDDLVDARYRALRKQLKQQLSVDPERLDAWILLMNMARSLERIADHATGIAQTVVYMQEGKVIRHTHEGGSGTAD